MSYRHAIMIILKTIRASLMSLLQQSLPPFKLACLTRPASALASLSLALALAGCGGGGGSDTAAVDPALPAPTTQMFTANAGTTGGSADASTAIALSSDWMVVADDEANLLRVYPRSGGAAVLEWSYKDNGPKLAKELDLEASARVGDILYFIGSHSNKKDGADAMADRSHLFAVTFSGAGANTTFTHVGTFSALESQLVAWDAQNAHGRGADYFGLAASTAAGIAPERVDGFSIEGMTTSPDDKSLWLAFRAPVTDSVSRHKALIVPVDNYNALIANTATTASFGAPVELDLGGRGIRSIDKGSDGRYLIIAGPSAGSSSLVDRNFVLFTWDGKASSTPVELDTDLDALRPQGGSFEAIVTVPGPVARGTVVELLLDNGDTIFPTKTVVGKDLPNAEQQFQGVRLGLGGTLTDKSGPALRSATPADDRVGVNIDSQIVLAFNEGIRLGSGQIRLHKADGTVVETFSASDSITRAQIRYNMLTLTPSSNLERETGYYLSIDSTAISDHLGNAYVGISNNSTLNFTTAGQPTALTVGDLLFVGANAEAPDAFAFTLLKPVSGGTQITFTDRNRKAGSDEFSGITNEGVFVWTANENLPAGRIVTIQTDVTGSPIADTGFTIGAPAGLGKEETIYAYVGGSIDSLRDGSAGPITSVGTYLASITLGGAAGTIPEPLTTAGTAFAFTVSPANQTNAIYAGSLDRSNLAAFAERVKFTGNWNKSYKPALGYPISNNGSLFGDQR